MRTNNPIKKAHFSEMEWSDLESLGWRVHRYDEKTRRYIYQTPIRKGMRKKIASKRDLDPCDRKYGEVLFPKISGKVAGQLRVDDDVSQVRKVGECSGLMDSSGRQGSSSQSASSFRLASMTQSSESSESEKLINSESFSEREFDKQVEENYGLETVVPGMKNHKEDLLLLATKLQMFMREHTVKDFNVKKSIEHLEVSLKTCKHPFMGTLIDYKRNFFEDALNFALKHTPDLLYVLMRHSFTQQCMFDHNTIIKIATVYTRIATSINPSLYCALNKWLSVVLQACGLTASGLEILSAMGITENNRHDIFTFIYEIYDFTKCDT